MILVAETYKISKGFPKDAAYGLTSQMRRCAISIPSNMQDYSKSYDNTTGSQQSKHAAFQRLEK
ncbi:MAG: hypothetical protein AUJ48_03315 [Deltaproteobacteria bacterium CG1_02_45_11]|nr:MAG: hypothetical protein AUJ48_03315 [Deltaproteobacteria bacterium CG1_02_45_11]